MNQHESKPAEGRRESPPTPTTRSTEAVRPVAVRVQSGLRGGTRPPGGGIFINNHAIVAVRARRR